MCDHTAETADDVELLCEGTTVTETHQISPNHECSAVPNPRNDADRSQRKRGKRKRHKRSGKKKRRTGRNRSKWKPFHKLSFFERKKLNERNARRRYRVREILRSRAVPLAPLNTTQFILQDKLKLGEDNSNSRSVNEFEFIWDTEERKRLERKPNHELIYEYISLESQLQEVERQTTEREVERRTKIRIVVEEILRMETLNREVSEMNARLTKMVGDMSCRDENELNKEDHVENFSSDIGHRDVKVPVSVPSDFNIPCKQSVVHAFTCSDMQ